MQNVYELRAQLEHDFIASLLTGLQRKQVVFADALDICGVDMLAEGGKPWAMYKAMRELDAQGTAITLQGIYSLIHGHLQSGSKEYPPLAADDVALFSQSNFGYEDGVKHYAQLVRREGVKRKAESKLMGMVSDCQKYGNEPESMIPSLNDVLRGIDGVGVESQGLLGDVIGRVIAKLESGSAAKPLDTPWGTLNSVLKGGIVPGELCVLAARPGLGKTAFAGCLAVEVARSGKPVLFVSREVKDETIAARILAREAKIDNRVFRQGIEHAGNVMGKISEAANTLKELPLHIVEKSTVPMTPREIRRLARGIKNIGLVVVDYLQLVNPDAKNNSREREVAEMSRAFKQLALDCNCPVLLLSQLSRACEERNACPQLSDLRESGAIEQDADIVIFLHTKQVQRSLVKCPVQVEVAKGRSSGTGTAYLVFNKPHSDFVIDEHAENWREPVRKNDDHGL